MRRRIFSIALVALTVAGLSARAETIDPIDLFSDHVTLTVAGSATTALTNFPLLVRVSESQLPGFSYYRADKSALAFTDSAGNRLNYDVDTWNVKGESFVWVGLPEVPAGGMDVTMHWSVKGGKSAPFNYPSDVWRAYAGVWHMNDATDSTANEMGGTIGNTSSVDAGGAFGYAIRSSGDGEPLLLAEASDDVNSLTNGSFTITFWTYLNGTSDTSGLQYLFSRRENFTNSTAQNTPGYAIRLASRTPSPENQSWGLACGRPDFMYSTLSGADSISGLATNRWMRHDIVFYTASLEDGASKTFKWYMDGELRKNWNISSKHGQYLNGTNEMAFAIGGHIGATTESLNGAIDEFRMRAGEIEGAVLAAEYKNTQQSDYRNSTSSDFILSSLVVTNGVTNDYWTVEPSISPASWITRSVEADGIILNSGSLRSGDDTVKPISCERVGGGWSTNEVTAAVLAGLESGAYRVWFGNDDGTMSAYVNIDVVDDMSYGSLGGTSGGRVLLMNNDFSQGGSPVSPSIDYQGYSDTDTTKPSYWQLVNTDAPVSPTVNSKNGTESILWSTDGVSSNKLWHLINCRHGNTFPRNNDVTALSSSQNYLPYSSKSTRITDGHVAIGNRRRAAGQLLMQNSKSAVVYSPCYTNGVGTLYFDAVNGWNNNLATYTGSTDGNKNPYQIVVEMATATVEGLAPTDENCWKTNETGAVQIDKASTDYYARLDDACWQPCTVYPVRVRDGNNLSNETATTTLSLAVENGGTMGEFYRVYVPVNVRTPVRFRIRRVSLSTGAAIDSSSYIVLDNLIASPPKAVVNLLPMGLYDETKSGAAVLGYEGAFSTPFPAVGSTVYGRAKFECILNGEEGVSGTDFISSARMHYRTRYLDQRIDDWKETDLDPDNNFWSISPLELPDSACDVEFYFDASLQAPYYKYVDYTGLGLESQFASIYSEAQTAVTNRSDKGVNHYPTKGSDWFVRLRENDCSYERVRILVRDSEDTAYGSQSVIECEPSANRQWRGLLKTLKPAEDGMIEYRIEGLNRQTAGAETFSLSTNMWYAATDLPDGATLSSTLLAGDTNNWAKAECTAATGYLMFLIGEDDPATSSSGAVTITHADYQNFNGWSDANREDLKFLGCFEGDDEKKSGASARKSSYEEDFSSWEALSATNKYWVEHFIPSSGNPDKYKTFKSARSMNGAWTSGTGMWVDEHYMDGSGYAIQIAGQGVGSLEFDQPAQAPRGIESLSLSTRLAQSFDLGDISYNLAATGDKSMTNYCFVVQAAMSTNQAVSATDWNSEFDGAGQISLFAGYRPGKNGGGYELRVVRMQDTRFKVSLYKWKGSTATEICSDNANCNYVNSPFAITGTGYPTYYISLDKQSDGSVRIQAGFSYQGGNSAFGQMPTSSGTWVSLYYLDNSSPFSYGSYGVGSANCPAVFASPRLFKTAAQWLGGAVSGGASGRISKGCNEYSPGTGSPKYLRYVLNDEWSISDRFRVDTDIGLYATVEPQPLKVLWSKVGSGSWNELTNLTVNSFVMTNSVFTLCSKDQVVLKLEHGADIDDTKVDIVIDDIELRQWCGDSYTDHTDVFKYRLIYGAYTNFVYTSGWVHDDGSVEMSAARASTNSVCSIRSPLMWVEDSYPIEGLGLGMFSFAYTNADSNVKLLLQIATNEVSTTDFADLTQALPTDSRWDTVKTFDFSTMSADELEEGVCSYYVGIHGVVGAMRLVMAPDVVAAADSVDYADRAKFGRIYITKVFCRDEPTLDTGSWWGWNLRTGSDLYASGDGMLSYISDVAVQSSSTLENLGISAALNNSVTEDTLDFDAVTYTEHLPFIQTPTFTNSTVEIGEVTFKARRYDTLGDTAEARVTVFGATSGNLEDDASWHYVTNFVVSADTYKTYSFKTRDAAQSYKAFRFAVVGVPGVVSGAEMDSDAPVPSKVVRVALDEVIVAQVVRAKLSFRNVFAFHSDMHGTEIVPISGDGSSEQPLAGEPWGVQAEVWPSQLPDQIDFTKDIKVTLYWFEGISPWGYSQWRSGKYGTVHSCELGRASDSTGDNIVFRSSYKLNKGSVIDECVSGTVIQYMLKVEYYTTEADGVASTWLDGSQWVKPSWYNGVDYNKTKSVSGSFAGYNIIDSVAPHWAWINEANFFGGLDYWGDAIDKTNQWVEVAIPADADITDWRLEFISKYDDFDDETSAEVCTVCTFGYGVNAAKTAMKPVASNCVFLVVANPLSTKALDSTKGEIDGTWKFTEERVLTSDSFLSDGSIYDDTYPVGIRLIRPSGIIEHEVACGLTNTMMSWSSAMAVDYTTEAFVEAMSDRGDPLWVAAGDDSIEGDHSLSVTNGHGNVSAEWVNTPKRTPGRINEGQQIQGNPPKPNLASYLVEAKIDPAARYVLQSFGEVFDTTDTISLAVPKGVATNITYTLGGFHTLDVTTNGVVAMQSARATSLTTNVIEFVLGANISNDLEVVAMTHLDSVVPVAEDSPYYAAIADWVAKGVRADGTPFENPNGEIKRAKFIEYNGLFNCWLPLEDMYWLDIDPTSTNQWTLRAGVSEPSTPWYVTRDDEFYTGTATNIRLSVYMCISNEATHQAYAPYILRGREPGDTSWDYIAGYGYSWTSAVFSVVGKPLVSGGEWTELNRYVFGPNSFAPKGSAREFESLIEVLDPMVPGTTYGDNPLWQAAGTNIVYSMRVSGEREFPFSVSTLMPTNWFNLASPSSP